MVFELDNEPRELEALVVDEVTIVSDQRFTWKGREKLAPRSGPQKFEPGYQLVSYVQLSPPAAATSTDLRSDWNLFAVGSSYGFLLYDYRSKHCVINRCTLNVQDFAIVSGDAGAMSRKKSFRKSLRESFKRLRRGRSQRNQSVTAVASPSSDSLSDHQKTGPRKPFGRMTTTGVRSLTAPPNDTAQQAAMAHRNLFSGERQVEPKVELSSIVKCITLNSAVITNNLSLFKPSLWVGTNSGQVLVYAIDLASEQAPQQHTSCDSSDDNAQDSATATSDSPKTLARLTKEIQLKHKAPIVAIFTSPEAPHNITTAEAGSSDSAKSTPEKQACELFRAGTELKPQRSESETNDQASEPQQAQAPQVDKSPSKSSQKDNNQSQQQPRVLICSEEQFKVFNLPNLKPFCKFKLTAHEGLRAKKISITQFLKPSRISNSNPQVGSKLQSATTLSSSKSLQSFATQTSPPASPVPPPEAVAVEAANASSADKQQQPQNSANGASTNKSSNKQSESNNNSLLAPNNNNLTQKQQDKELLNAKFGAKANPSSATTSTSAADKSALISDEPPSADSAIFEPYMVCMSNQGDCAIYSVPDLKRQAQIQVCKREDVNGITSAMLTNYGEGYYLRSSSNFLRFSISSQRVLRVLSVV